MKKYDKETIEDTRKMISKRENLLRAQIKTFEVWFWGDTPEELSNEMIAFALDIIDAYQNDKKKYDYAALDEVKEYLKNDDDLYFLDDDNGIDDLSILDQLGTPIINVVNENNASLMYGGVEEVGNHMPEVLLNRDIKVKGVALNG